MQWLIDEFNKLADQAEARAKSWRARGQEVVAECTEGRGNAYRYCATRLASALEVQSTEKSGIWPASKLPTCPKCGWPPMVDEENATEDDPAPIVCAC